MTDNAEYSWQSPGTEVATESDTSYDVQDGDVVALDALWEGDESQMPKDARLPYMRLLKYRFVTGAANPKEFKGILEHRGILASRLNEMFLQLHVDVERQVAWKTPANANGVSYPTLLQPGEWSREETMMLAHLRARARADLHIGRNRSFVDRAEIQEHIASLRPTDTADKLGEARRVDRAIDSIRATGLLIGAKGANRFEIPIRPIEALIDLATLKSLLDWMHPAQDPENTLTDYHAAAGDLPDEDLAADETRS